MINVAQDVELKPITEGIISENVISHYSTTPNAVAYAENLNNDILGYMKARSGLTNRVTPSATPLSCTLFQQGGTTTYVYWQEGTTLKRDTVPTTGSSNTYAATFSISTKARYDKVQGYLVMTDLGTGVKYVPSAGGTPTAIAGIAFPTLPNLISAGFVGRIWVAYDQSPLCRLYYTDVIPATGVEFTTDNNEYIDINANNNDTITALVRTQNVLFVFTSNSIFRVYNTQSVDNSPVANVGTVSQEAVVQSKDGTYFYHPSGIYKLSNDGSVTEISKKISDIIQGIYDGDKADVVGWHDADHVYFSIGYRDSAGDSLTKTRVVRYTINSQVWTVYSFTDTIIKCATTEYGRAVLGSSGYLPTPYSMIFADSITGTSTRMGAEFIDDKSTSSEDPSSRPIFITKTSNWMNFGIENHSKSISGLSYPSENAGGTEVYYQIDNDDETTLRPIGRLSDDFVTYFKDFKSKPFNRIRFVLTGNIKSNVLKLGEPTILKLTDNGYPNNYE